ncbi:MAG: dephospho-CoA kinase [Verrucomicrobia bacterium]|nr:dephospho-CoA kinase [Verrucomicrobiota bacterium]
MAVIGVTGGIGSGKSTFSKMLADHLSARLFDADSAARELLESDPAVREKITAELFAEAYTPDGKPDRAAIRRLVFQDPAAKARLESILHPRIRERWTQLAAECRQNATPLVVEIPLLFETGAERFFDRIATVACSHETQLARTAARSLPRDEAESIIRSQIPLERKTTLAYFVVWNDGSLTNLENQASELAKILQKPLS